MIINFFIKNKNIIFKNHQLIKFLILVISTFLIDIKLNKYSISSDNLLYENLIYNNKIVPCAFKDEFVTIKSPARTILILINKKDTKYVKLIYGSLKFLKPRLKEIIITYRKPLTSKYFIVINLKFSDKNYTKIYPISNLQPNSDLLYISQFYFPIKLFFSPTNLLNFPYINYSNTININLEYSRNNIKSFLLYLKTLSFIDSFDNGTYFFIPLKKSKIDIMQLLPFCICIFLLEISEWFLIFKTAKTRIMCLNLILFFFVPWTCFFCLLFPKLKAFLMLIYFSINFRYGYILFIISYFYNIYKLFFKTHKLKK